MNKKSILLAVIIIMVSFSYASNEIKGSPYPCMLYSFSTDKNTYFNDEEIKINATWELNYNPSMEIAYIEVMILDVNNLLLWNSTKYSEIGNFTNIWNVNIESLNLEFANYSNTLFVKVFFYISNGYTPLVMFMEIIEITTIKRNVSCELIGYSNYLKYGEDLFFKAQFFNNSFHSSYYLENQDISFKIISLNVIIYERVYVTNLTGELEILISCVKNLSIGVNYIQFKILENQIFDSGEFEYTIYFEAIQNQSESSKKDKGDSNEDFDLNQLVFYSIGLIGALVVLIFSFQRMKKI